MTADATPMTADKTRTGNVLMPIVVIAKNLEASTLHAFIGGHRRGIGVNRRSPDLRSHHSKPFK